MEISKENFINLLEQVMQGFKKLETELMAYKMTLAALKQFPNFNDFTQLFEQSLEHAAVAAPLAQLMHEKYQLNTAQFLQLASESDLNLQLHELLEKWQRTPPLPN